MEGSEVIHREVTYFLLAVYLEREHVCGFGDVRGILDGDPEVVGLGRLLLLVDVFP